MVSLKFVTPVKTGIQRGYKLLKRLDSGFRRNDEKLHFQNFCEISTFDPCFFEKGLVWERRRWQRSRKHPPGTHFQQKNPWGAAKRDARAMHPLGTMERPPLCGFEKCGDVPALFPAGRITDSLRLLKKRPRGQRQKKY